MNDENQFVAWIEHIIFVSHEDLFRMAKCLSDFHPDLS